jgi:membrane protease YdiL (CAAX protease family)
VPRRAEAALDGGNRLRLFVVAYLAAIAAAEICVVFVNVWIGVLAEGLLALASINHYHFAERRSQGVQDVGSASARLGVLLVIPLVPLVRILSLTMTLEDVSDLTQYSVVGIPLLLGAILTGRVVCSRHHAWRPVDWPSQGLIALSGVPLGFAAFLVARPPALHAGWRQIVFGTLTLSISAALTEEFIFRGLLQETLSRLFGGFALLLSTGAFAITYLAVRPVDYLVLIIIVGLLFAWAVERTGSLVGVVLAHGLLNIGLLLVWPWVVG